FRSSVEFLRPEIANQPQFPLDGARGATELRRNLVRGVTFHLPQRHRLQLAIAQPTQQALALFGDLGRELGTRLPAQEWFEVEILSAAGGRAPRRTAATFLPAFCAQQLGSLASRDHDQQPPKAIAIQQLWDAIALGVAAEAMEGAEGHV